MSLVGVMNESKSLLDKFIDAQTSSKDACSSRLIESKRVLDGLLKDVNSLNSQVLSLEQIVESEMENLKISKMTIEAVKTTYKEAIKSCNTERRNAIVEYKKYAAELNELRQIAMPSARYHHAVKVHTNGTNTTIKQGEILQTRKGASLLQVTFDKEECLAFLKYAKEHDVLPATLNGTDCDKKRGELQEAFTKAYAAASKLKEDAKERALDKTCYESAHANLVSQIVPLVSQRDSIVEKINSASHAIVALEPVMKVVKMKAEKLRTHISKTLTPECKEADQASKLLVQVRELILSLEECPGRNDFILKVPSKEAIAQAAKAMEEEAEKEEAEKEDETPATTTETPATTT